ncbi:MAG TPA: hypothetical protein ENH82_19660 [bacterium]|nr:hypothetical protein [bacterium]
MLRKSNSWFLLRNYFRLTSFYLLFLLSILLFPINLCAETKEIFAEATYIMGDGETPSFAETMVMQEAKRIALEQAGTYLESYSKIEGLELKRDEIQTIAGGVLETIILERDRVLVGDGIEFSIKIKATITTDKVNQLAERLKGKNIVDEYNQLRNEYLVLKESISDWKRTLYKTEATEKRNEILKSIKEHESKLNSLFTKEERLVKKILSGKSIIYNAESAAYEVDTKLNFLLSNIINDIKINLGEVQAIPTEKENILLLKIPIDYFLQKSVINEFEFAVNDIGGKIINENVYSSKTFSNDVVGNIYFVQVGSNHYSIKKFQRMGGELRIILTISFNDKSELKCIVDKNNKSVQYWPLVAITNKNRAYAGGRILGITLIGEPYLYKEIFLKDSTNFNIEDNGFLIMTTYPYSIEIHKSLSKEQVNKIEAISLKVISKRDLEKEIDECKIKHTKTLSDYLRGVY